jgi:hypothetical protein
MEQKINLAKLLKDCPCGMELDCTMYDNVTFDCVTIENDYPIKISTKSGFSTRLTKYGQNVYSEDAKCVIFPKGKKTWEGFQRPFKDGDIVFYNDTISIFKEWGDETLFRTYVTTYLHCDFFIDVNIPFYGKSVRKEIRLATEKEKERLFQIIKNNGYKWNEKTKTLEKKLTFKDGDILTTARGNIFIYKGLMYYNKNLADFYCGYIISDKTFTLKLFKDRYFGNVTECRFATEEERQELFQAIKDNGYKWDDKNKILEKVIKPKFKVGDKIVNDGYLVEIIEVDIEGKVYGYKSEIGSNGGLLFIDQDEWELVPNKFNFTTLKPFDKVLVRDSIFGRWKIEFFEKFDKGLKFPFICMNGRYSICIPYNGNEYLHDTINPCSDYYQI